MSILNLIARHGGVDHMDMGGMSMGGSSSSSSTTMPMDNSTSTAAPMPMAMHMFFTKAYHGYPVLFETLSAKNDAQAFGIFVLLFCVAFALKGADFYRMYLEQKVWNNPSYLGTPQYRPSNESRASLNRAYHLSRATSASLDAKEASESEAELVADSDGAAPDHNLPTEGATAGVRSPHSLRLASSLFRDAIRLFLCVVPEIFGFALMLAAMSFCLVYFFAIVVGLGCGRFFFEKLSYRYGMTGVTFSNSHCA